MGRPRTPLFGIGINDADYLVQPRVNGRNERCHFYVVWADMFQRCYCKKHHLRRPTYIGCSVAQEWHLFSNFKKWMETQDWHGKQLDKDILVVGNKIYSPDTCVFVDAMTNGFVLERGAADNGRLIGSSWNKRDKKFESRYRDPFTGKSGFAGYFDDEMSAHLAWKKRKHEFACMLADLQGDERVAAALRLRYA